ncbi:MAG: circadian clock KaiB family protein [Methylomonas sp.]|nr:circadian clock KaiB family protein [Methylomonas sp.]
MSSPQFLFTLYVASIDAQTELQICKLRFALAEKFKDVSWELELVEVLDAPEKAVANDIFATPTLVREKPKPVVKVLDGLTNIPETLLAVARLPASP